MNYKLLIITFSWLATIGGIFLFSSSPTDNPKIESQRADIVGAMTTSVLLKTSVLKPKLDAPATQTLTSVPTPTSSLPTTASPTATQIPTPTPTRIASPILTPAATASPTDIINPTSTPPPSTNVSGSPAAPSPGSGPTATLSTTTTPQQSAKININTANSQELDKITGVGPVIAQRIIDYRQKKGPFQKIEDIKNVSGIGDKNFEKMRDEITI